jgi:hypothetical protein
MRKKPEEQRFFVALRNAGMPRGESVRVYDILGISPRLAPWKIPMDFEEHFEPKDLIENRIYHRKDTEMTNTLMNGNGLEPKKNIEYASDEDVEFVECDIPTIDLDFDEIGEDLDDLVDIERE